MKGGNNDDKVMGPMFPRLHVNDTEKGGPRAPPRNKMALYEQLSIPSQRYNTGQRLPLNPNNNLISQSLSIQQGNGRERSMISPLHVPPSTPPLQGEELQNIQSDVTNLNSQIAELAQRKKAGDEDDFRVPIYFQSDVGQHHSKNHGSKNGEKVAAYRPTDSAHSTKMQHSSDNYVKQTSRPSFGFRSQGEMNPKESVSTGLYSVSYGTKVSPGEKIVQPVKSLNASALQNSRYLRTDSERICGTDATSHQEHWTRMQPIDTGHCNGSLDESRKHLEQGAFRYRNGSGVGVDRSNPSNPVINSGYHEDQTQGSREGENVDRSDEISENSMVDSISGLDISPDDVVGIIGYKHFLRARKAITNQQRVFAVQVFELHRLIKVQRLIAGSPQILVEDGAYLGKPSSNCSPTKKLPLEYVIKSSSAIVKQKDTSVKPNHDMEFTAENAVKTVSSVKSGTMLPHQRPTPGQPPSWTPSPGTTDSRMDPWCLPQPPGHQWLVPVISPSEGLIYKPYPGPSFMSPVCGGRGSMGEPGPIPFTQGNFMNAGYSIPASHPPHQGIDILLGASPVGPGYSYFPPYGMPVNNPAISGSAIEQLNPFTGPGWPRQAFPSAAVSNLQHQSSGNLRGPKSAGAVSRAVKYSAARDNELQGSTASSPSERRSLGVKPAHSVEGRDALSLFPESPTILEGPSPVDEPARVIRVVPHNARTATESAARIFQTIQEERKQFDSS